MPSRPKINSNKNYKKISQDKSIQSDSNVTDDCDSDSDSEIIILQPQLCQNYNHPPTVPEVNQSEPVLEFQEGQKESSDIESEIEVTQQPENSLNTGVSGRSERVRKKTKIFTYNELGQAPSYVTLIVETTMFTMSFILHLYSLYHVFVTVPLYNRTQICTNCFIPLLVPYLFRYSITYPNTDILGQWLDFKII